MDYLPTSQIKLTGDNPVSRMSPAELADLADSIRRSGILQPLTVDEASVLIDGHRRLACALDLGIQSVPVCVVRAEPSECYVELNRTTKRFSSLQWLGYYLRTGLAPERKLRDFRRIERIGGRSLLERIFAHGLSAGLLDTARSTIAYVNLDTGDDADWMLVIKWLVDGGRQAQVRTLMNVGCPPLTLRQAIQNNTDVRLDFWLEGGKVA
jgi:hypothetical protein